MNQETKNSKLKIKNILLIILVLVLVVGGFVGGYSYKNNIASGEKQSLLNQIERLEDQGKQSEKAKTAKEYINNELGFSFNYPRNLIIEEREWFSDGQSQTITMKMPGEKINLEGSMEFPSFHITIYNNIPAFLESYNMASLDDYFNNNSMISKCNETIINGIYWKECTELGITSFRSLYAQNGDKLYKLIVMDSYSDVFKLLNSYMDQVVNTFELVK